MNQPADLTRGEIINTLKRHEVIPNPDTGVGLVCMWCGDQPQGMSTETHQAGLLAPAIRAALRDAWEAGKKAAEADDLFGPTAVNPFLDA